MHAYNQLVMFINHYSYKFTAETVEGGAQCGGRDPKPDAGGVPREVQGSRIEIGCFF